MYRGNDMAEFVLTTASTILCDIAVTGPSPLHGGTVSTKSTAKLRVNGSRVLPNVIQPPIVGGPTGLGSISGCTNAPPPPSKKACLNVTTVLPVGVATKLTVGGIPALLATLKGTTDGVTPGTLSATAGQAKLRAS